jgi:hypothetical protein
MSSILPHVEMVAVGPAGIKIPKPMTISPMRDLINELKKSNKFMKRLTLVNSAPQSASAPNIKSTIQTKPITNEKSIEKSIEKEINSIPANQESEIAEMLQSVDKEPVIIEKC